MSSHCGSLAHATHWVSPRRQRAAAGLAIGVRSGASRRAFGVRQVRRCLSSRQGMPRLPGVALAGTDLHDSPLTPSQGAKREWLRFAGLLGTRPGHRHRRQPRPPRRRARGPRLPRLICSTCPGCSSSAPTTTSSPLMRNPIRYLLPDDGRRHIDTAVCPGLTCCGGFERRAGST
jgi:hypothetical protein